MICPFRAPDHQPRHTPNVRGVTLGSLFSTTGRHPRKFPRTDDSEPTSTLGRGPQRSGRGHHERVNAPELVEIRSGPDGLIEAVRDDERIAVFVEQPTAAGPNVRLVGRQAPIDPVEVRKLLDALTTRAGNDGLRLETNDPLVRDIARRHGFSGLLRGPLAPASGSAPLSSDDPAGVRDTLQLLLPGIAIEVEAKAGPARALLRRAVSGVSKTFNLFAAPNDLARPTRFSVPERDDVLIESVARCIDTTIAIRRRYGRVADAARRVSFDHADFQLLHGNHAGSADRSSGLIHMNASFSSLEGLTMMEQLRAQRVGGGSAGVDAPFNGIDGTTAHEVWHQMEGAVEARRSMDGIDLRRRLGEALGVETLEQAVNGSRPRSPDTWKIAHARLVNEVSAYGATAPVEATAEMFKLWWCATGEPSPIVCRFGELIEPLLVSFNA